MESLWSEQVHLVHKSSHVICLYCIGIVLLVCRHKALHKEHTLADMDRNKNTLITHEILLFSYFPPLGYKEIWFDSVECKTTRGLIKIAPNTLTNKSKSMLVSNPLLQCLNVPFYSNYYTSSKIYAIIEPFLPLAHFQASMWEHDDVKLVNSEIMGHQCCHAALSHISVLFPRALHLPL